MADLNTENKKPITQKELDQRDQGPIQEEFPSRFRRLSKDSEEQLNKNPLHNAWIIIGRDRPAGLKSGYGQYPENKRDNLLDGSKSSTIDIGVGRYALDNKNKKTRDAVVGNHIQYDSARIYISQKTDIDENFLIDEAGTLANSIAKSAIGLKADAIRLAARENIKIVANTGDPVSSRSIGIGEAIYGIQLITGIGENASGDNVQGIVKSENLRLMLDDLITEICSFLGMVATYIQLQTEFNESIANHTHEGYVKSSPQPGCVDVLYSVPAGVAYTKYVGQLLSKINLSVINLKSNFGADLRNKYLDVKDQKKYIGSIYNKTN